MHHVELIEKIRRIAFKDTKRRFSQERDQSGGSLLIRIDDRET